MKRPEARRALVTGASAGIGLAVAKKLAARGLEVWMTARGRERLEAAVAEINAAGGGKAHALVLDVADTEATVARLAQLDAEVGGIDLVVANAGLAGARGAIPLPKTTWADVRDILHTNLLGAAATVHPFIVPMVQRGHGQLVGISSISADCPIARSAAYGGSKAGLTFFLECADIELRALGVDVTIVHPGFVSTPAGDELAGQAPRPLLVSADKMARVIDRAIVRRSRLVRYPWIMGAIARLTAWLPRVVMSPLIRLTSGERPAR
ncbi:MAG TPA: SDR family NAD(P)-dependent oxidoreductase [Polyangia bacterium]|nr:SDR family NAD(P)-dependent oxidoreductase [Polyangia bacterium]